jgi:hypothetical protein
MNVDDAIQNHEEQRDALREALAALLFLRAKSTAETGTVPAELRKQLRRLQHALCGCSERLIKLQHERLTVMATSRADAALARLEVEQALY